MRLSGAHAAIQTQFFGDHACLFRVALCGFVEPNDPSVEARMSEENEKRDALAGRRGIVDDESSRKWTASSAPCSPEELLEVLYVDLRRMAAGRLAREHAAHTLQPTALVHEAWIKLGGQQFENKAHFFGSAAEAMRRILVDRARRHGRQKRGSGAEHAEFEESQIESPLQDGQLLEVHEALDQLAAEDPVKAEVVKLRFFVGLTHLEVSALLGMSEKTARRHWQVAKIRLFQIISEG